MTRRGLLITSISGVVILAGLTAGGIFGWHKIQQHRTSQSIVPSDTTPANTLGESTVMPDTTQPTTPTNQAPKPSEFKEYDKYIDNKTALFGDIKVGTGTDVKVDSKVTVVYKGWLTDGKLFDESKPTGPNGRLQGFQFTEGKHEVIAGWEQAIFGMKAGGVRRLIVPPALGYGALGQGNVPGNAVLVFDVELISVE